LFVFIASCCGTALPQQPPVILVDGYHLTCPGTSDPAAIYYLDTCSPGGDKPTLEHLGDSLGQLIEGTGAPQVDVISHSMGGLVVRCYLSGKQTNPGVFNPPANPKVRKFIAIASPNFGALFSGVLNGFAPDVQASELASGSRFIYDLATWNQGRDDLREVDALGIAGNAGGVIGLAGGSDGIVAVTSASLGFAVSGERTRVLPACHNDKTLELLLGFGCLAPAIAKVDSTANPTWRIVQSFLAGTEVWKTIGHAAPEDPVLSVYGGLLVAWRDAMDDFPLSATGGAASGASLAKGAPSIYYNDFLKPGAYSITITESNTPATAAVNLPAGRYTTLTLKPGPSIALAAPAAGLPNTLALAPGEIVAIYGTGLANAAVQVSGEPAQIFYNDAHQINVLLPSGIQGYATLTLGNGDGRAITHFLTAPAVPAVFTLDESGGGPAAARHAGDQRVVTAGNPAVAREYIEVFATGLDTPPPLDQLHITLGGIPIKAQYAGPAPGYPGLDQINLRIPDGLASGPQALIVETGGVTANATTVAIR
jgi:uncharacterized protein (TIGR03437 family)